MLVLYTTIVANIVASCSIVAVNKVSPLGDRRTNLPPQAILAPGVFPYALSLSYLHAVVGVGVFVVGEKPSTIPPDDCGGLSPLWRVCSVAAGVPTAAMVHLSRSGPPLPTHTPRSREHWVVWRSCVASRRWGV